MSILLTATGALRSGWKFAAFAVFYPLCWFVASIALFQIFLWWGLPGTFLIELAFNAVARFFAAIGALLIVAKFVEHKPASVFIGSTGWLRKLAIGVATAAVILLFLLVLLVVSGGLEMRWAPGAAIPMLFTLGILVVLAANEELLFRGYPLQALAEGLGPWPASVLMSLLFGLVHVGNDHASVLGIINTVLAGLLLSVAYFKARSLWFPYGIHVAWNIGLGVVLGFSLSGTELDSFWKSSADGPAILTGALYGPEGGLLCTFVFLAGLVAMRVIPVRDNRDNK